MTAMAQDFELAMWKQADFKMLERRLLDRENIRRTWALILNLSPDIREDIPNGQHFNKMVQETRDLAEMKLK